jgi:hypothetical protein
MLTFTQLLEHYPAEHSPCQNSAGHPNFGNQCAIRMGVCLGDAGVDLRSFRGVRCWHGHSPRHILRAQELADWLKTQTRVFGTPEIRRRRSRTPAADEHAFSGRNGIILCQNFWGAGNQGDHIDLWNDTLMVTGTVDYITRSQQVWFWPLA